MADLFKTFYHGARACMHADKRTLKMHLSGMAHNKIPKFLFVCKAQLESVGRIIT